MGGETLEGDEAGVVNINRERRQSQATTLNTSCCFGCCKTSNLATIEGCSCSTFENNDIKTSSKNTGSSLSSTFAPTTLTNGLSANVPPSLKLLTHKSRYRRLHNV